jgi:hypothetical protein
MNNKKYLEYEEKVIENIEKIGEMTRSDAQGITMVPENEVKIKEGFKNKTEISIIAKNLLEIDLNSEKIYDFEVTIEDVVAASAELGMEIDYETAGKLFKKLDFNSIEYEALKAEPYEEPEKYVDYKEWLEEWLEDEDNEDSDIENARNEYEEFISSLKDDEENNDGKQYQVDAMLHEIMNQLKSMKEWKQLKKNYDLKLKKSKKENINKIQENVSPSPEF